LGLIQSLFFCFVQSPPSFLFSLSLIVLKHGVFETSLIPTLEFSSAYVLRTLSLHFPFLPCFSPVFPVLSQSLPGGLLWGHPPHLRDFRNLPLPALLPTHPFFSLFYSRQRPRNHFPLSSYPFVWTSFVSCYPTLSCFFFDPFFFCSAPLRPNPCPFPHSPRG